MEAAAAHVEGGGLVDEVGDQSGHLVPGGDVLAVRVAVVFGLQDGGFRAGDLFGGDVVFVAGGEVVDADVLGLEELGTSVEGRRAYVGNEDSIFTKGNALVAGKIESSALVSANSEGFV